VRPVRGALALAALIAGVVLLVVGCGGGGSKSTTASSATTSPSAATPVPPAVAAKANANCRALVAETKRVALGTLHKYGNNLDAVTAIVSNGIPVLERVAARQRALQGVAHSPAFDLYVGLFDPIIVLLQQRQAVGKAPDLVEARRLNGLAAGLSVEQRHAARNAGLADCDVNFRHLVEQAVLGNG
jgi:hypothetical protein